MGFNLENDKSKNDKQMSLFDFQMPQADFAKDSSAKNSSRNQGANAIDFDAFLLAHREPEQSKTSRFLTLSATIHAAAILVIAMMTVPLIEEVKTETITIEIEDVPQRLITPRGAKVPPTQGGTPVAPETPIVEKLEDAGSPGDVVVAKPKAEAKAKNTAKLPKALPVKATKSAEKASVATAKGGRSVAPKTAFKAVPMTIDDIEAPELDEGQLAKAAVASPLSEDFNEDFANIDKSHGAALDNEKKSMEALAAAMASEQDETLAALDEQNKAEADQLASLQNDMRQRNSKAIASALANERAAAMAAAAREAAAREAASKKAGLGGNGNGRGMGQGAGAGNVGSPGQGTQLAGTPTGIRSLDQLRQMPGNPRPHYDREERRNGHQGAVAFVAYITKEGYPKQFRMMKSTGYRNLDSKTLAALKKWRFYPGQEGWVELPFKWDLKGGALEDGGLLRRSASR